MQKIKLLYDPCYLNATENFRTLRYQININDELKGMFGCLQKRHHHL